MMEDEIELSYEESSDESIDEITEEVPEDFEENRYQYFKKIRNENQQSVKCYLVIKNNSDVKGCIAFCIDLMYNKQYPHVVLSGINQNIDKAVFIAELLKRKVKNLH